MVIQSYMTSKAIVEVWKQTKNIFDLYRIPIIDQSLDSIVAEEVLTAILNELNFIVGSSTVTCIEGG